MLPNAQSFCELDPDVKDRWGLPVLKFNFQWGVKELARAAHQHETYLRTAFGFIGLPTEVVVTEGVSIGPDERDAVIQLALSTIEDL